MTISVSGTVFQSNGTSPDLSGLTLFISIAGAAHFASTTSSVVNGTYSFAGITASASQTVAVYLQGNTPVGLCAGVGSTSNITGRNIVEGSLLMAQTISQANLQTIAGNADSGITSIISSASASLCTLTSGINLGALSGVPFAQKFSLSGNAVSQSGGGANVQFTFTGSGSYSLGTFNGITLSLTGTGAVTVNGGTVTLASPVTVAGAVTVGSAGTFIDSGHAVTVGGNWSNSGTCTLTGTTTLNGTGQVISGSTTFGTLVKTVSSADTLKFTDGTTTTVSAGVTLEGASGQLLALTGTSTGGWTIAMLATQTLGFLDVSFSTAIGNTAVAGSTSTNGGNNVNWTFGAAFNPAWAIQSQGCVIGRGIV